MAKKPKVWVVPVLRVVAFFATVAAAIVMALNKQTKTMVVATIGSTPIKATLTAKFQHTPAFVFFVIANAIAGVHNLFALAVEFFRKKFNFKGLRLLIIVPILDMMIVALVSAGVSSAAFMGELGRNGNSHARWNKICDKFDTFCDHGSGAIIASLVGLLLLMIINVISILNLRKLNPIDRSVVP
ncbi:CASP-like protein [Actinidia chinensis var. chinensis]|uniref:CASP-like protein n=1 Tax=Actinidia chinensis var. chinensis TaxID=1590841 RepID=A0A2R6RY35_ACTCC|nr:CASP-like protein [Actinidia chinensis var. chinensis]